MSRLPVPGSDSGVWGDILNDYLEVEHNADGTLKPSGSLGSKYTKPVAGIPKGDLTSDVQTSLGKADTALQAVDVSGKVDKSTLTTKGDVYAASAASTPVRVGVGTTGQVLTADPTQTAGLKWGAVTDADAVHKGDLVYNAVDFGADASGVADSTSAFQAALDVCSGRGGIVFAPAGTYLLGALTQYSSTILRGTGIGTLFKLKDGANTVMISTRDTIGAPTTFPHDHIIEDISFDLNRANNPISARAIEGYRVRNHKLQRCKFTNFNNECVRVFGDTQFSIQPRFIDNQFDQGDPTNGVGIVLDSGTFDSWLDGNDVGRAWRGIVISNGGYGNHKLVSNWTWGHMDSGVYVFQSHGNQFSGHTSESNFGDGIVFDGCNDNAVTGGRVSDNSFVDTDNKFGYGAGFGTANVASGVKAINDSVGIKFNGTLIVNPLAAQKYGILASGASTLVYQIGCTFSGQGTADTSTSGGAQIRTFTPSDDISFPTAMVSGNLAVGPGATLLEERLTIDGNVKVKGGQTINLENSSFDSTLHVVNGGGSGASLLSVDSGVKFAGQLVGGLDTMTYASVIVLSVTAAFVHKTTTTSLVGDATINASSGGTAGQVMYIVIANDAASGRTITFGTNFKPNGTLVGTIGKTASLIFVSDGTNFYETSRVTGL